MRRLLLCLLPILTLGCGDPAGKEISNKVDVAANIEKPVPAEPSKKFTSVQGSPEDVALWIHPSDSSKSIVFSTDASGALNSFGINGQLLHQTTGLNGPSGVDVEYGMQSGESLTDIAVVAESAAKRLRFFSISPKDGALADISGATDISPSAEPDCVAFFKRQGDRQLFVLVSTRPAQAKNTIIQYSVTPTATGKVDIKEVRRFGVSAGVGDLGGIAVDSSLGFIYYCDPKTGVHKYFADPQHLEPNKELALFGTGDFKGSRGGIGIFAQEYGLGYIVISDVTESGTLLHVYKREGEKARQSDHRLLLKAWSLGSVKTTGLEVTSVQLGEDHKNGGVFALDADSKSVLFFDWDQIANAGKPELQGRDRELGANPYRKIQ